MPSTPDCREILLTCCTRPAEVLSSITRENEPLLCIRNDEDMVTRARALSPRVLLLLCIALTLTLPQNAHLAVRWGILLCDGCRRSSRTRHAFETAPGCHRRLLLRGGEASAGGQAVSCKSINDAAVMIQDLRARSYVPLDEFADLLWACVRLSEEGEAGGRP